MNIKTSINIKSVLRKDYSDMGWGLCIGAGTSYPIFPTWSALVESLIKRDSSIIGAVELCKSLLTKFSPDTLIQAVQNKLKLSDSDFAILLAEELYAELKSKLTTKQWESLKVIFESRSPHLEKDPVWKDYIEIRDKYFKMTSAYSIGKFVCDAIDRSIQPEVIISFNAESLLFSLINSFEREKYLGKVKKAGDMVSYLDRLTHSISPQKSEKVKYVFCHGFLCAPLSPKKSVLLTASDKLVFSESSYLNIANTSFSWQSTEFVSYCLNKTIVFIGVSLTDPNMRRWLSWIHKIKETEIQENGLFSKATVKKLFSHFWINKIPEDKQEIDWIEACVKHLGIHIIWIKEWNELHEVLNLMIE
ncbi:hypothetical protein QFZ51_003528 [Chitinophaga sp. W3I9]|uniref:SIR2 family protein n=1 Tax=Chitinophaga sp. W3I9 TaxID=3373924 RepID=UPI003D21ABF5